MKFDFQIPALFVPVERVWIADAVKYFKTKDLLYFYTDSKGIANAGKLGIKSVYFKLKGEGRIDFKADFVALTTQNPKEHRLFEEAGEGKYYYGFKNLRFLKESVPISNLKYYSTDNPLRNDVPGACIVQDPMNE